MNSKEYSMESGATQDEHPTTTQRIPRPYCGYGRRCAVDEEQER